MPRPSRSRYAEGMAATPAVANLLDRAEQEAEKRNGHLMLLRFTIHWKCAFGTPDLDSGDGRAQVAALLGFLSLEEALLNLLANEPTVGGSN